jgi:acyl-CoA thioester hydrolase
MGEPALWRLKVRHYEVDSYGHVNHAYYAHYFETARIEALEGVGLSLAEMRRHGYLVFAADLSIKYRSPAQAGETLEIMTYIRDIRGARSLWVQEIREAGSQRVVATAEVTGAFMTEAARPVRAPQTFIEKLSALCVADGPGPRAAHEPEAGDRRRWCLCRSGGVAGALRRLVA